MKSRPSAAGAIEHLALAAAVGIAACCAAFLWYSSIPWIRFSADLAIWAESAFVGDIIKLQTGVPLYTPPEWSNSMIYTPGAPWLTWVVMKAGRIDVTVAALRWVQVGFVLVATVLAVIATGQLRRLAPGAESSRRKLWWFLVTALVLFLASTAPEVNRHVFRLHNDALALLASMVFWVCLLRYVDTPRWTRLVPLVLLPAIGFAVKQFLIAWLPVTALVLALLPAERLGDRVRRAAMYAVLAGAVLLGTVWLFRSWWGEPFQFWVFDVMGGERKRLTLAGEFNISILRSIDHAIRAWWELALGFVGGWLLLRRGFDQRLIALFVAWTMLVSVEALGSGAGWNTLYHFGPGVVIGVTWLMAALPSSLVVPEGGESPLVRQPLVRHSLGAIGVVAAVLAICVALRVVPTRDRAASRWFPGARPSEELTDYVTSIEREFAEFPPADVLLDIGNWVYLPTGFLARDRAISLADQAPGGHYQNFEPFLERIRNHEYRKIMVQNFHDPKFLYDYDRWTRSSGVRRALETYYVESRIIPGVVGAPLQMTGPVSILVPRTTP